MAKKSQKRVRSSEESHILKTKLSKERKNGLITLINEIDGVSKKFDREKIIAITTKVETLLLDMDRVSDFIELNDEFINRNYLKIIFSVRLARLYHHLGDIEKAFQIADFAFDNIPHFSIIAAYHFLASHQLIKSNEDQKYQLRLLTICSEEPPAAYKRSYEILLKSVTQSSMNTSLCNFAKTLSAFYSNNHEKIQEVWDAIQKYPNEISIQGIDLCSSYAQEHPEHIDSDFIRKFDKLLSKNAHLYLLIYAVQNGKLEVSMSILEKPFFSEEYFYRAHLASILIGLGKDLEKATHILEDLIRLLTKKTKLSEQQVTILGKCYHQLGRIHFYGLYQPEYIKSKELAAQFYLKAAHLNYPEALEDLGLIYQDGNGIEQNLQKAEEHFSKAIAAGNKKALLSLVDTNFMRTAYLSDAESQKLMADSITLLQLTPMKTLEWHYKLGFLMTVHDIGLKAAGCAEAQFLSYDITQLFFYENTANRPHSYKNEVKFHLETASENKSSLANQFLALLYTNGKYLDQDLEKAEFYLNQYYASGKDFKIDQVFVYYTKMMAENDLKKKQEIRLKAVSILSKAKSLATTEELKECFGSMHDQLFREIDAYERKQTTQAWWQAIIRQSNPQIPQKFQLAQQLNRSITIINELLDQKDLNHKKVFTELINMNGILKNSRAERSYYKEQLKKLMDLMEKFLAIFPNISLLDKIEIIKTCSFWPIIKGSIFKEMLDSIEITTEFSTRSILSLASALLHARHAKGLFLEELKHLCLDKLPINTISTLGEVTQIIHIFAIIHANCIKIDEDLSKNMEQFLSRHLPLIAEHWGKLKLDEMSKVYIALNYLRLPFHPLFSNIDPKLSEFMIFQQKVIKKNVTISQFQQQVFHVLKKIDSAYEHETISGGRSVDFCKESTGEVLQVDGPSHFDYDFVHEKPTLVLNSFSILCEKTLILQGKKVSHINYEQWDAADTDEKKIALVQKCLFKQGKKLIPATKKAMPGENPSSFYHNLNMRKKNENTVSEELDRLGL